MSSQTPRQQLVRIINRFNKANPMLSKLDYAPTELVDAILAVFTGLPAMQEEVEGGPYMTHDGKLSEESRLVMAAQNALRRQILAELEAIK